MTRYSPNTIRTSLTAILCSILVSSATLMFAASPVKVADTSAQTLSAEA